MVDGSEGFSPPQLTSGDESSSAQSPASSQIHIRISFILRRSSQSPIGPNQVSPNVALIRKSSAVLNVLAVLQLSSGRNIVTFFISGLLYRLSGCLGLISELKACHPNI